MHPIDKQYIKETAGNARIARILRFSIDLAVGATMAALIIKEYFGQYNQIACLIVIAYAQLSALVHTGNLQAESNSDKIDIVKDRDSKASRELWEQLYIAQNKTHMNFFYLYCFLHLALIGVSFWRLFSAP